MVAESAEEQRRDVSLLLRGVFAGAAFGCAEPLLVFGKPPLGST